jgi:DNA adenine methylase
MFDLDNRLKPPFKWVGGKQRLLDQLIPLFPKSFNRLVEPFCGTASVALALKPGILFLINDMNREIACVWRAIETEYSILVRHLYQIEYDYERAEDKQAFYLQMRGASFDRTDYVSIAGRFLFLNKAGFNALYRLNKKGQFNVPWGKREKVTLVTDNLREISRRLGAMRGRSDAGVTTDCAFSVIEECGKGDFGYVDPPYVGTFSSYTKEGFSNENHVKLAHFCNEAVKRGASVAVSNSDSELTRLLYKDWVCHEIVRSGTVSSKGTGRQPVKELLFTKGY